MGASGRRPAAAHGGAAWHRFHGAQAQHAVLHGPCCMGRYTLCAPRACTLRCAADAIGDGCMHDAGLMLSWQGGGAWRQPHCTEPHCMRPAALGVSTAGFLARPWGPAWGFDAVQKISSYFTGRFTPRQVRDRWHGVARAGTGRVTGRWSAAEDEQLRQARKMSSPSPPPHDAACPSMTRSAFSACNYPRPATLPLLRLP